MEEGELGSLGNCPNPEEMKAMKSLIICVSIHHQNTLKIARIMAEVLGAEIKKPNEVLIEDLLGYDLIGFGSGIYIFRHHREILKLARKLPDMQAKPVFIFSTSGAENGIKYHKALREIFQKKNCRILDEFNCLAWDSFGPLKLIGGVNKDRPNEQDLNLAKNFALKLKEDLGK